MKRGPKSAGDIECEADAIASGLTVIQGGFRKTDDAPPPELTEPEAAIWRAVIATEAKEFFASAVLRGMLADYCRHKASADKLSEFLSLFELDPVNIRGMARYEQVLKIRANEIRAATSLATKMRLTNQSRYGKRAAHTAARNANTQVQRPWDL